MTSPDFHASWTRMRSLESGREWMRWEEFYAAVKAAGINSSSWTVRRVLLRLPKPERRHQMNHYTPEHLAAVIERLKTAAAKETT